MKPCNHLLLAALLVLLNVVHRLSGAPGDLDPLYDAGGLYPTTPQNMAAIRMTDGSLVLAGRSPLDSQAAIGLYRILPDGRLDATFGQTRNFSFLGLAPTFCEVDSDRLLLGGAYAQQLPAESRGVIALDRRGQPDLAFQLAPEIARTGNISHLAAQPDGLVLIAKEFSSVPVGTRPPALFRVLPDGQKDPSWKLALIVSNGAGAIRSVLPLANGRILAAGRFMLEGEQNTRSLVRLLSDGQLDPDYTEPSAVQGLEIGALTALPEGVGVIVRSSPDFVLRLDSGGETDPAFAAWRGQPRLGRLSSLASTPGGVLVSGATGVATLAWDGEMEPLPWLTVRVTGRGRGVILVAREPDGDVIVAGSFDLANERLAPGIAKVRADGEFDPNFARIGPTVGNQTAEPGLTQALLLPDAQDRLLVAGRFTQYNSVLRHSLARLESDGALDLAFEPEIPTTAWVSALAATPEGNLLVGLTRNSAGQVKSLIKLRSSDGRQDQNFVGDVGSTLSVSRIGVATNGMIYVDRLEPGSIVRIVKLRSDGSRDAGFLPPAGATLLAVHADGRLVVRDGQVIRRLLPDGQHDSTFEPVPASQVASISLEPEDSILAAGYFPESATLAARWFSNGQRDAAFRPPSGSSTSGLPSLLHRVILISPGYGPRRFLAGGEVDTGFQIPRGVNELSTPVTGGEFLYATIRGGTLGTTPRALRVTRFDASAFDFAITEVAAETITLQSVVPYGRRYVLEASPDLLHWRPIATNTASARNLIDWTVPQTPGSTDRFFRTQDAPPQ